MILPLLLAMNYRVAPDGDDAADGRAKPWRTLARASKPAYRKGDRLVLSGRLVGTLILDAPDGLTVAGTKGAVLDGGAGDGIVVRGGSGLRIESLALVADGRKANDGRGLHLVGVRDAKVVGIEASGFRFAGVEVDGCANTLLDRVFAHDNGGTGIGVIGGYGQPRSKDVTIRACRALDNPGDPKNLTNHSGNGIVVGGVDGCLIELCEAANNGWDMPRDGNGPVGIWAWNASRVTIRRNISHDNRSPGTDGGGFDLDGGVTDSRMEGNLSYRNAGTGYLLCQYSGGGAWRDNVVRGNMSVEDGQKNFHSGIALYVPEGMTNMTGAVVERNLVVNARYGISTMGDVPGVVYRDNAFVAHESLLNVAWGPGSFKGSRFERNAAWPASSVPADWTKANRIENLQIDLGALPTDPNKLEAWLRKRLQSAHADHGLPLGEGRVEVVPLAANAMRCLASNKGER